MAGVWGDKTVLALAKLLPKAVPRNSRVKKIVHYMQIMVIESRNYTA